MLFPLQAGNFFLPTASRLYSGPGIFVIIYIKQAEGEVDLSPLSSSEVKNEWRYMSTPPYTYVRWCLISNREKFPHAVLHNFSEPDSPPETPMPAFFFK
jgi:hypothetical protein